MLVFRIASQEYISDLSGLGARLYGGRWNSPGVALVYTSGSRALALLEVLVHLPAMMVRNDYAIAEILLPDNSSIKKVITSDLPKGWEKFPGPIELQEIGNNWVRSCESLILQVPSALVADEYNYLVNPAHPDAAMISVKKINPFNFNNRLIENKGKQVN